MSIALSAEITASANTTIKAHCIHRLWNNVSETIKATAATTPNRGNAVGPYAKTRRVATGKLTSPSKIDPNLTAARPSQQKTARETTAMAHDSLRARMAMWRFTANDPIASASPGGCEP